MEWGLLTRNAHMCHIEGTHERRSVRGVRPFVTLALVSSAAAIVAAGVWAASAPLPLQARVLRPSDMQIFPFTGGKQTTAHDAAAWSRLAGLPSAALRKDGFVAGIREDLHSYRTDSLGVSTAAQFRTSAGAADAALRSVIGGTRFAVPGIPGARGFGFYRGSDDTNQFYVSFSDGDFEYLVGFARPSDRSLPHTQALLAAATSLYRRVAGRLAP